MCVNSPLTGRRLLILEDNYSQLNILNIKCVFGYKNASVIKHLHLTPQVFP